MRSSRRRRRSTACRRFGVFSFVEAADPARRGRRPVPRVGARRGAGVPPARRRRTVIMVAGLGGRCCSSSGCSTSPTSTTPRSSRRPVGDVRARSPRRALWPGRGARARAHRPEPPNPAADDVDWERAPRERPLSRARPSPAVTEVLRDPPGWEGRGRPRAPGRAARRAAAAATPPRPSPTPVRRRGPGLAAGRCSSAAQRPPGQRHLRRGRPASGLSSGTSRGLRRYPNSWGQRRAHAARRTVRPLPHSVALIAPSTR